MKILMSSLVDLKKSQHNRPHQLVKHLSKKNEITVLSINDWWKGRQGDLEQYSSGFNEIFENIDYHYLTERKITPFIQEVFFKKKIAELSKMDFDVHLNYNSMITGYNFSKQFKTVFDLADDIPAMIRSTPQIPRLLKSFGGRMADYYIKKDIKRAQYITLTTKTLKKSYNIPEDKFEIIPNGVDLEDFKKQKNAKEDLGFDGFIVGYVGVLREWVDFKPVFEALKFLNKEIKLLIVGSEGQYNKNKSLARKIGVEDRVIFTGMVSYSEIPKYISAMDVGLIPFKINRTSENALPLKLFEYMACEKPVISTKIKSITSEFNDNVFFASNPHEYINKINFLFEDRKLGQRMGKDGRSVCYNHDWKNISDKMEKILNRVAS